MPSAVQSYQSDRGRGITKFINCFLVRGDQLVKEDLWISSITGSILPSQKVFYEQRVIPDRIIDLGGKIISPGFIDVQINGAFGFDFSVVPEDMATYAKGLLRVNKNMVKTGVTSYLPTVTSQKSEVYHQALPYLGPSGSRRNATDGAESLGAHVEGPFLSATKNGIHDTSILQVPSNGISTLEEYYGPFNLQSETTPVKLVTIAPELPGALSCISELKSRGIVASIGHSEATYEEASEAVAAGATMITHLFNAMRPLHHRNPGIFGLLGTADAVSPHPKPSFGIIADGIHLHPTTIKIAWNAHPDGFILVTDAMRLTGLPDGIYDWTNGSRIIKTGSLLTLEGTDKIAGSSLTLVDCVTNFLNWSGASVPEAIGAVTRTPAKMLGIDHVKGSLEAGADADVVVLDLEVDKHGLRKLSVDQVWKFGALVFEKENEEEWPDKVEN